MQPVEIICDTLVAGSRFHDETVTRPASLRGRLAPVRSPAPGLLVAAQLQARVGQIGSRNHRRAGLLFIFPGQQHHPTKAGVAGAGVLPGCKRPAGDYLGARRTCRGGDGLEAVLVLGVEGQGDGTARGVVCRALVCLGVRAGGTHQDFSAEQG